MGKNFDLHKAKVLSEDSDKSLENYLKEQFELARNERISALGERRLKKLKGEFFYKRLI